MTRQSVLRSLCAIALGLFLSATAHAQLFRTYIAPDGVDGNPCTLAAPCRLLPAALATVIDGGEIWMLGSANYNTSSVNIAKSVTILAVPGALGSVVAIGGNAINIATAGVKVSLRNLVIVPFIGGGGLNGIYMTAGTSLTVENCLIANLPQSGIFVVGPASVLVTDTTIRDNLNHGLFASSGARATVARTTISRNGNIGIYLFGPIAGSTTADIADSTISNNSYGVYSYAANAAAVLKVTVHDSRIVGNAIHGITAASAGAGPSVVSASNNVISNNGTGILASQPGARVWASGNTVSNNVYGLDNNAGLLESAGDNAVRNNTTQTQGTITPIPKI